jgi:hypothetical protein
MVPPTDDGTRPSAAGRHSPSIRAFPSPSEIPYTETHHKVCTDFRPVRLVSKGASETNARAASPSVRPATGGRGEGARAVECNHRIDWSEDGPAEEVGERSGAETRLPRASRCRQLGARPTPSRAPHRAKTRRRKGPGPDSTQSPTRSPSRRASECNGPRNRVRGLHRSARGTGRVLAITSEQARETPPRRARTAPRRASEAGEPTPPTAPTASRSATTAARDPTRPATRNAPQVISVAGSWCRCRCRCGCGVGSIAARRRWGWSGRWFPAAER